MTLSASGQADMDPDAAPATPLVARLAEVGPALLAVCVFDLVDRGRGRRRPLALVSRRDPRLRRALRPGCCAGAAGWSVLSARARGGRARGAPGPRHAALDAVGGRPSRCLGGRQPHADVRGLLRALRADSVPNVNTRGLSRRLGGRSRSSRRSPPSSALQPMEISSGSSPTIGCRSRRATSTPPAPSS